MKKYILGILLFIAALFIPSIKANSDIMSLDETEGMPIAIESDETWTRVLDTDVLKYGSKISLRDEESLCGYFGEYIKLSNAIINEYGAINKLFNGEQQITITESIGQVRFEIDLVIDNFFNCSNSCYIGSGDQNDTCKIKIIRVLIRDMIVGYADFTSGGCHNNCDDAIDVHTFTEPGYFFDTYNVIDDYENYDTSVATWASYMFENMFYFSDSDRIEGMYSFEEASTSVSFNSLKLCYDFEIASGANGADVAVDTYDYYYDKVDSYFYAGFIPNLAKTEYFRAITMYSKFSNSTYKLGFEVSINENECTYLVKVYDGTKTEILLHILYSSSRVMTFEKVTSEHKFNESVIITDFGTWEKAEYNDDGYFVGLTNATTDEVSCLGFYGYELVDYGDIVSPVVESSTINLSVDELLSTEDILNRIEVRDDRDTLPEIVVESSTYTAAKQIGTFYINVYAVDDYENESVITTITINVTDTTTPTLSADAKTIKNTEVLTPGDLLALFAATDNYYASEELTIEIVSDYYTDNAAKPGNYAVQAKCTDPSGNVTHATTYINVIADISGEDIPTPDTPVTPEDPENPNTSGNPDTPVTPEDPENYNYNIQSIFTEEFWNCYVEDLKTFNFAWPHWTTLGLALLLVLSFFGAIIKKKS